jgi:hypothetical protein
VKRFTEQVLIRPESGGEGTDGRVSFAVEGDSGAVVVNRLNQVVALLHGAAANPEAPEAEARFFKWGVASQIHHVGDQLGVDVFPSGTADLHVLVAVAPTGAIVPGTGIMTRSMTPEDEARGAMLDEVVEHLRHSANGRFVLGVYAEHTGEVRALLDHDRRVKIAWHRNGGPALVARLLTGPDGLDQPIPTDLDGVPVADALRRVVDVFAERGSAALAADAARYAPAVLEILRDSTTIRDALERVRDRSVP